jgi:DNA-binding GntR family transcriptional regulator
MNHISNDCRTLSESLFVQLAYEIGAGIRKPGEPIREVALSRTHGISRTPVRLALDRLVEGGFATRIPNLGVRVAASPLAVNVETIPDSPPEVVHTTIRERTYERILEWITTGRLKPGERLIAGRLSKELNVGETPVILALQMLGQGGMVRKNPRRGYYVQNMDLHQVEQIYDVREYLEGAAAALAAKNLSREGRGILLRFYDQTMDRRALVDADTRFHQVILENSGNNLLEKHLKELLGSIRLFHVLGLRVTEARLQEVVDEHRAIISSVLNGDSASAELHMREHMRQSRIHTLQELVEFGLASGSGDRSPL